MSYHFYIELAGSKPLVWRRIIVPDNYTFLQLHLAIQAAFGWENRHLFSFSQKGLADKEHYGLPDPDGPDGYTKIKDASRHYIREVFTHTDKSYIYVYDFGDYWEHKLMLEIKGRSKVTHACCTAGAGACPPEDSGGIEGYKERYLKTPALRDTLQYDPSYFDEKEAKQRMALLG